MSANLKGASAFNKLNWEDAVCNNDHINPMRLRYTYTYIYCFYFILTFYFRISLFFVKPVLETILI